MRSEQQFYGVQLTLVKKTRLLTPTARGAPDEFPRPWVVDKIFPTGLFLVSFLLFVGHGVNKPVWGRWRRTIQKKHWFGLATFALWNKWGVQCFHASPDCSSPLAVFEALRRMRSRAAPRFPEPHPNHIAIRFTVTSRSFHTRLHSISCTETFIGLFITLFPSETISQGGVESVFVWASFPPG